ncbi:MAG: sulfatase [Verrucomicrobiales bacterium]|nr:sulfatase [Verrucomicrobiales bacterium]
MKHLSLFALVCFLLPAAAQAAQPHFVFFITDDISLEDTGTYGGPIPTPNMDRLAASGMRFNNAYVTASSCSPSRNSIITSRYPHNTGAPELHTPLPRNQWKFPGRLRRAGYHSVLSGKNHMSYDGVKDDPIRLAEAFDLIDPGGRPSGSENWVKLLRDRPEKTPCFFWFGSHDAHRDWQLTDDAPQFKPDEVMVPPYLFDGPETRHDFTGYYHEVARTDHYLGLLLDELERQGIADSTYLIFTSDNGRPFPRSKTRLYDSGAKVPFLIAGPEIEPGTQVDSLVSLIDIGPTVLELAGIDIPGRFQGVSLVPLFQAPEGKVRDYVFAEHNWHTYPANERMVRFQNWVYIRNYNFRDQNLCAESSDIFPAGKELWEAEGERALLPEQRDIFLQPRPFEELFNLSDDPHQFTNLIEEPEHAAISKQLREAMDQWRSETGDTTPVHPTSVIGKISPEKRGDFPGAAANAESILKPGPVLLESEAP